MNRTTSLLPPGSLRAITSAFLPTTSRQVAPGRDQARPVPAASRRLLPWLGVAVLYVGTSMLAAGFLAQRALMNAYSATLDGLDPSMAHLADSHTPVAVWWVPETMPGFMIALALMLLGLGLLAADGDRERSATYGK